MTALRPVGYSDGRSPSITFAYNGLGERVSQSNSVQTVNYTLDIAAGLSQVLADGTHTYLYGLGRIAQQGPESTQYFLTDALGSVRQLATPTGNLNLSQAFNPFGEPLPATGLDNTAYGFAGEWTDTTGLQYLRARYYTPDQGRFLSRDTWAGDYTRPTSLRRYTYVENNPVLYTDPTGHILDPSEPTLRGIIIHNMIQFQYAEIYSMGGVPTTRFEVPIPFGSKSGLKKITTEYGEYWGVSSDTLSTGYADIVDIMEAGLYEIKPIRAATLGAITMAWYISAWNIAVQQGSPGYQSYLMPGLSYPKTPVIVGTDPNNKDNWITANLNAPGVITYWTTKKTSGKHPVPVFVFEWNPTTQRVEKRYSSAQPSPVTRPQLPPIPPIIIFPPIRIPSFPGGCPGSLLSPYMVR